MNNVMIDIETLGTKPGCIVLSIAAVAFEIETGKIGVIFHRKINLTSSTKLGFELDTETFLWWLRQEKSAQDKISNHKGSEIKNVLREFAIWLMGYFNPDVQVWGNSARFDLGILEKAYQMCKIQTPWNHFNERDVRTLVSFAPEIKKQTKFKGIKHYPIDDCKHQINYCSKIYQTLRR